MKIFKIRYSKVISLFLVSCMFFSTTLGAWMPNFIQKKPVTTTQASQINKSGLFKEVLKEVLIEVSAGVLSFSFLILILYILTKQKAAAGLDDANARLLREEEANNELIAKEKRKLEVMQEENERQLAALQEKIDKEKKILLGNELNILTTVSYSI